MDDFPDELERNVWSEDLMPSSAVSPPLGNLRLEDAQVFGINPFSADDDAGHHNGDDIRRTSLVSEAEEKHSNLLMTAPSEAVVEPDALEELGDVVRLPELKSLLSVNQRISFVTLCFKILHDLSGRYLCYEHITRQSTTTTLTPSPKPPAFRLPDSAKQGDNEQHSLLSDGADVLSDSEPESSVTKPLFKADFLRTSSQDHLSDAAATPTKHPRSVSSPAATSFPSNSMVKRIPLEHELASEENIADFMALSYHVTDSSKPQISDSYSPGNMKKATQKWKLDGNLNLAFAVKEFRNLTNLLLDSLYVHLEISQDEILFVESTVKGDYVSIEAIRDFIQKGFPNTDSEAVKENLRLILVNICLLLTKISVYDAKSRTFVKHLAFHLGYTSDSVDINEHVEAVVFCDRGEESTHFSDVYSALKMNDSSGKKKEVYSGNLTANERTFMLAKMKVDEKKRARSKRKKIIIMSAAAVGGGVLIGATAGIAAPAFGAGIGAILATMNLVGASSGAAAFFSGIGGGALITGGGFLTGTGVAGRVMSKRLGDIDIFRFIPICTENEETSATVIISISGWIARKSATESAIGRQRSRTDSSILTASSSSSSEESTSAQQQQKKPLEMEDPESVFQTGMQDLITPFLGITKTNGAHYALSFDPHILKTLGDSLKIFVSELISFSANQALAATILAAIMSGLTWPMWLLKLAYFVDNPFSMALDRAKKAGYLLADSVASLKGTGRSITLCGFSMGARVVYYCCLELAKRGLYGLVEDVFMFGAPVLMISLRQASQKQKSDAEPSLQDPRTIKQLDDWRSIAGIVSGRLVNAYSRSDWVLGFLFRGSVAGIWDVAGLQPVLLGSEDDAPRLVEDYECGVYKPKHKQETKTSSTKRKITLIENIDLTSKVTGHLNYRPEMPWLVKNVCGFATWSDNLEVIEEVVGGDWLDQIDVFSREQVDAPSDSGAVSASQSGRSSSASNK